MDDGKEYSYSDAMRRAEELRKEDWARAPRSNYHDAHYVDITPEMRDNILSQ